MEEFRNIPELLRYHAGRTPDKTFLISETDLREWTFAEFEKEVSTAADFLRSRNIRKGDVVSILLPNSPEYILTYFACWEVGAIASPVNSLLKPEEIDWVIGNSEAKLVMSDAAAIADGRLHGLSDKVPIMTDWSDPVGVAQNDKPLIEPDDDAIIIYTSGTTGKPKGCLLTHANLLSNARQITEWLGFGPEDRLLTVMPLFHMNAVTVTTMTALFCGGSTVISPKFSASRFWDVIEKHEITSFGSVATMLSMLLQKNDQFSKDGGQAEDLRPAISKQYGGSLRFAMCGSAPVPAEVLKKFEETFEVLVIEGYGLSESTCRATFNPPNDGRRPGSCGLPIGNEMKVFDENNVEVPDGNLGEIVLRGPNIFKGYFKNPEATAKAFDGGWFHTGDIGYRDADGFFYIADRKSDMIIRGGENIYPREIDDLLYTHPAVEHAAVIGVPDELYGEEVAAFIVLKEGFIKPSSKLDGKSSEKEVSATDIIDFCKRHLADYKCPKSVHFVDDIPKGPTGKLLKRELARLHFLMAAQD
ncbi:MAG TPA: long-chain fatty acid--CoA ligase [Pyrinomonadaceae bacterium]|nr:long-chain fatty acid--CoA ligase [Pyrinomonadaceae bacterium]